MDASAAVLDKRLDSRVGKMVARGLRNELQQYYDMVSSLFSREIVGFQHKEDLERITHGVMQCIGPKEFLPYLRLSEAVRQTEKGEELWKNGSVS